MNGRNAAPTEAMLLKIEQRDVLSPEERSALESLVTEVRVYEPGQDIVSDGERPAVSSLLIDGFAARYKILRGGERQITELHVKGDFVDIHNFLLKIMDHGVTCITRCQVAPVPHDRLAKLTTDYPHVSRLLWLMTLIDGAIHREWLVAMGRRPALAQTAHLLCELYLRLKTVNAAENLTFTFPVTQAELGDVLGLSAVHVNRVLQELRSMNLITWRGPTVTIHDWEALTEAAEFDPRYLHLLREPR